MGEISTKAKQKQYTQIKVSVDPDIASAFKNACFSQNLSLASVLSQFMAKFAGVKTSGYNPDLSTKRQRRAVVSSIICQLKRVLNNEVIYQSNIPENLQGSSVFERAEECISSLSEALELLDSAYWYH